MNFGEVARFEGPEEWPEFGFQLYFDLGGVWLKETKPAVCLPTLVKRAKSIAFQDYSCFSKLCHISNRFVSWESEDGESDIVSFDDRWQTMSLKYITKNKWVFDHGYTSLKSSAALAKLLQNETPLISVLAFLVTDFIFPLLTLPLN
jgi:hypothetical protein